MDKKAIFEIFFKCNSDDEHKFNDFSQMTHAGKRIIFSTLPEMKWNAPIFD